ncbi:(2Fe-2S)-binding protein [Marinomonas ostreistagni]|uniref:(2Fe-2S)-binding protein n=1 Tax=Marinomonas ostreistagni TaxID=359209 RepID=UPI0019529483|nr:(2Fe-2S)-binding protein [Marinomonas ostreistagni]MBM6550660.1 (2Fe-2S)-binding protein [Marinomonas ostreistagni]
MQALTNLTQAISPDFTQVRIDSGSVILASRPHYGTARLAHRIAQGAPEAGAPFWRLRTWGMLIWQPVFLAILSVHGLQSRLVGLAQLDLRQQHNYTLGFALPSHARLLTAPDTERAMVPTAADLQRLCQRYANALSTQLHSREPLLMAILADTIFTTLEHLVAQQLITPTGEHSATWVYQQGQKWCQLMGLKVPKTAQRLQQEQSSFQRKTCCLIYRCEGFSECANCPRAKRTKQAVS